MFKSFVLCSVLFISLFFSFATAVKASPVKNQEVITSWAQFTFENDVMSIFNKSDDGYSNGLLYSWGKMDYNSFESIKMPAWIRYISDWTYINQGDDKRYSLSYGISQRMYTPEKLEESALIEDDRPYAGTLLWNTKIRSYADNRANSLGLILGVAGPASLAEQSQTIIHKLIDATTPEGWDNQINNELVFRVEGEHIERFYTHDFSDNLAFDSSSYSQAGLGNLSSDIGTGLTIRLGNMLDQTYANINPKTSGAPSGVGGAATDKFYWQLYTSLYASYLFNDLTLNGNTFSDSHSVELVNEQILFSLGASILYNNWGMAFSIHRGNYQFEGQQNVSNYGSLTISYHY